MSKSTRDPLWLRKTARVLSSLLQANESDMATFVRERLDGAALDPTQAADARAILVLVGEILVGESPERASSLAHARRLLEEWKAPAADPPKVPPPSTPAPAPLPWAPPASAPVAVIRAPATSPAAPSPWAAPGDPVVRLPSAVDPLDMTAPVGARAGAPLPFAPQPGKAPPRVSLEPHAAMGQTAPAGARAEKPVLPFGGATLTLERYAQFWAERERWPTHRAQTCATHGVAEADEDALHQRYRAAFARDPALAARFQALCDEARRRL